MGSLGLQGEVMRCWMALVLALCLPLGCSPEPARADPSNTKKVIATVQGKIKYFERSGRGLYVELALDGKTVGVEVLAAAAKKIKGKLKKGRVLWVKGKRHAGLRY